MEPEQTAAATWRTRRRPTGGNFAVVGACAWPALILQQRTAPEPGLLLPGEVTQAVEGNPPARLNRLATAANDGPTLAPTVTPQEPSPPRRNRHLPDVVAPERQLLVTIDGNAAEWVDLPNLPRPTSSSPALAWDGKRRSGCLWQSLRGTMMPPLSVGQRGRRHPCPNQIGNQIFRGDSIDLPNRCRPRRRLWYFAQSRRFSDFLSPGDFSTIPTPSAFRFRHARWVDA